MGPETADQNVIGSRSDESNSGFWRGRKIWNIFWRELKQR
jgi:hypothetical protein